MNEPIRTWAGVAGSDGPAWVSSSYGVLPSQSQFTSHFKQIVGHDAYTLELAGSDAELMQEHYGGPEFAGSHGKAGYALDADELWGVVESLTEAWDSGDDAAGDFASAILYTLHFEWI